MNEAGLEHFAWMIVAASLLFAVGCTDTMQAKRGGLGEFCNGADVDCREGMICSNNVCIRQNRSGAGCRTVCDAFSRCQVGEMDCFANCAASLDNWRRGAVEAYAACYEEIGESECAALREFEDGPQNYCVSEIPQIDDRVDTCESFDEQARSCLMSGGFEVSEYQQQLNQLSGECRLSAKTLSLEVWNEILASGCESALDSRSCRPLFECVNEEFDIGRTEAEAGEGEEPFPPFPTEERPGDESN